MDKLLLAAEVAGRRYEIIDGGPVGSFVFAYDEDGRNTHDYLQDDVDMAKRCAEHQFGVPRGDWRPAASSERPLWQRRKT